MGMDKRVRYTINDVSNNRFYQMPKFLFEDEFKSLSNDARCLYALLKDRHELSLKNQWINEKGEVYLIYTRVNMQEMLGLSDKTTKKAVEQLKSFGLMEEEQQGLNMPNRIYLTAISLENKGHGEFTSPDKTRTRRNYESGDGGFTSLGTEDLRANDTDINKTDNYIINNQSVSLENYPQDNKDYPSGTKEEDGLTEIITNLYLDDLKQSHPANELVIDEIELIIKDMWYSSQIKIRGEFKPQSIIRSVISKLNPFHIEHVLERLEEVSRTQTIKNTRGYLENMIYSSVFEMNTFVNNTLRNKKCI